MEGKHFLIKFIFSNIRKRIVVGRMEERKNKDSGQEKTLESMNFNGTAKIRTLKLFRNSSKNGGHLYVKLLYEVFVLSPMDRKDYMVSE